jgi:DedD protein
MDRALKERIIGAIVLVLFVVLVVPVFLDGPSNSGEVISEHVPLPGQSGDENQTIVLNRDRTLPVPAVSSNNPPADETQNQQEQPEQLQQPQQREPEPASESEPEFVAEPELEPEPAQKAPEVVVVAVAEPASSTGMWAVQLGSFGNKENADKLAADLKKLGFAAFRSQLKTSSGELHRVRVGPQKDRDSAEIVAVALSKAGQKGQVVPHP